MEYAKIADAIDKLISKGFAYDSLEHDKFHAYAQKYLMPKAWGKNVFNAVLEDAIRMRKEQENAKSTKS